MHTCTHTCTWGRVYVSVTPSFVSRNKKEKKFTWGSESRLLGCCRSERSFLWDFWEEEEEEERLPNASSCKPLSLLRDFSSRLWGTRLKKLSVKSKRQPQVQMVHAKERPAQLQLDQQWDACIDLTMRRFVYGSLAGAASALLLFRSPTARWAAFAFGAGVGLGSAYADGAYIFSSRGSK